MKSSCRFLIALMALSYTTYAQSSTANTDKQAQIEAEIHQDITNSGVFIHQLGNENQVMLTQAGLNANTIRQIGSFNSVHLTQNMAGGYFQVTQDGSANVYEGNVTGEDIELSILQHGNSNTIQQLVTGRAISIAVTQDGNYNELKQTSNSNSMDLRILQRGNDMRLIIK
jgi:hypothetical protein